MSVYSLDHVHEQEDVCIVDSEPMAKQLEEAATWIEPEPELGGLLSVDGEIFKDDD